MAIVFDEFSFSAADTVDLSWTHITSAVVRAVVVFVITNGSADTGVADVTYGGVSLPGVALQVHDAGEQGTVQAYFLGTGLPPGSQTVLVTVTTADVKVAGAMSVVAGREVVVQVADQSINDTFLANPTVLMGLGGKECFVAEAFHSGRDAASQVTPLSGWLTMLENDFGSQTAGIYRYSTVGDDDLYCGWTQAADDATMIALAVREVDYDTSSGEVIPI